MRTEIINGMTEEEKYRWFYGTDTFPLKDQMEIYNAYLDAIMEEYRKIIL